MTRREFITMLGGVAGTPFICPRFAVGRPVHMLLGYEVAGIVPVGTMLERRSEILSKDQWRTP
jgi:hypothetical protein